MVAAAAAFATARVAPRPWRPAAAVAWRFDASDRENARVPLADATPGDAADAADADPEALILARCGAQIAAEAGPGAVVHASGARRQAALLDAAVAALPASRRDRPGPGRSIVYLPRSLPGRRSADALLALLQRTAARHGDDALLVVAIETTEGHEDVQLDRLARVAGWQLCQRWSDGFARHALHVLERSGRAALLRAR